MLTKEDIETLERLTNSGLYQQWEGMLKKLSYGSKVTVANTGLYSSGKSSLFNAILGRMSDDNMRFPVGAIPTTKTGDREALTGNIDLLDTPGIDANSTDDSTAFDMLMQSDIIIMTHNVKRGMLDRSEYEWLKKIAGNISRDILKDRVIFAATWTEEIHDDEDMQKLRDELHRQVKEAMNGEDIRFIEVSAKMFRTGVEKDKKGLQDKSGIPELREMIITMAENFARKSESLRRQELLNLCGKSKSLLNNARLGRENDINSRKRRISDRYKGAFEKWKGILGRFSGMRSNVQSKLNECKSISYDSSFESRIYDM